MQFMVHKARGKTPPRHARENQTTPRGRASLAGKGPLAGKEEAMNRRKVEWPSLRLPPINLWVLAAWREGRRVPQSRRSGGTRTRMRARAELLPIFYARRARCL